jgi:hypothetical protein
MLPVPTVACEYMNSDAVFVGTVVSMKAAPAQGEEYDGWLYDLRVQRWFRGPGKKVVQVFTENSSGRFPLDLGKQYLLFADMYDGRLEITNCGNSSLFTAAKTVLRELRKLQIPADAEIEGDVVSDAGPNQGGLHVVVRSGAATYTAVTDHDGWFHLHVPPGTYSAEVEQVRNLEIVPFGLSEDPSHFEARAGRCVGLRYTTVSRSGLTKPEK